MSSSRESHPEEKEKNKANPMLREQDLLYLLLYGVAQQASCISQIG
jgi:hypothetical protein